MTAPDLRAESALLRLSKRAARWVSTLRVFAAVSGGAVAWEHAALLAENFFPSDAQVQMERALAKLGGEVVQVDGQAIRFTWGSGERQAPVSIMAPRAPRAERLPSERPASRTAAKAPMTPEERSARGRRAAEARWKAAGQLELPGTYNVGVYDAEQDAHATAHANEHREHANVGSIHAKNNEQNAQTMLNLESSIVCIRASVEHREHAPQAPQASRAHSPEIRIPDPSSADLDLKDLTGCRATPTAEQAPAENPASAAAAAFCGTAGRGITRHASDADLLSIPERRRVEFIQPPPPPPIALPADLDLLPAQRANLAMVGYTEARLDELVADFKGRFAAEYHRPQASWVTFLWGYVKKCGAIDRRPAAERARLEAAEAKAAEAAAETTLKLRQAKPKARLFTPEQNDLIMAASQRNDLGEVMRLSSIFESMQLEEDRAAAAS